MNFFYIAPLILQKIIWVQTRLFFMFFLHLKVEGLENLKDVKKNAMFASNHISELDPLLIPSSLPFFSRFSPMFYVTLVRSEYMDSGWRQPFYGGAIFKFWGGHPVYLGLKDYAKSLVNHIALIQKGRNILVFPEGQITKDGLIQPARGGISFLSEACGCPIVPISISGAFKISNAEFFRRKRHVTVHFGKPIYQEELKAGAIYEENMADSTINTEKNEHEDRETEIKRSKYKAEAQYVMSKIATYTHQP